MDDKGRLWLCDVFRAWVPLGGYGSNRDLFIRKKPLPANLTQVEFMALSV